jgi:hypothetical protein
LRTGPCLPNRFSCDRPARGVDRPSTRHTAERPRWNASGMEGKARKTVRHAMRWLTNCEKDYGLRERQRCCRVVSQRQCKLDNLAPPLLFT